MILLQQYTCPRGHTLTATRDIFTREWQFHCGVCQ